MTEGVENNLDTSAWSCELTQVDGGQGASVEITVGGLMQIDCHGSEKQMDKASLQFVLPKEVPEHGVKILEIKDLSATRVQMLLTSYLPGDYDLSGITLSDGNEKLVLKNFKFEVNSVIDPNSQQQPFPDIGPFDLSSPWWFWASWAGALFLLLLIIGFKIRKFLQRKKLIENLRQYQSTLTPFQQLSKELRQVRKKFAYLATQKAEKEDGEKVRAHLEMIEKSYRLYLVREFLVPAETWTDRQILRGIKKYHKKIYKEFAPKLYLIFEELKKAQKAQKAENLRHIDCVQLADMITQLSEKIFGQKRNKKS